MPALLMINKAKRFFMLWYSPPPTPGIPKRLQNHHHRAAKTISRKAAICLLSCLCKFSSRQNNNLTVRQFSFFRFCSLNLFLLLHCASFPSSSSSSWSIVTWSNFDFNSLKMKRAGMLNDGSWNVSRTERSC